MDIVTKQEYTIRCFFLSIFYILISRFFPDFKLEIATILVTFYLVYYQIIRKLTLDISGKTIIISGCDSGFGLALANNLLAKYEVFLICGVFSLESAGAKELKEFNKVKLVKLNITDQKSVDDFFEEVKAFLSVKKSELWGLVNNAGISTFGDCSWVSPKTYQMMLDVNLVGHIRMCQKVGF